MNTLITQALAIKNELIGYRRALHQIPEVGATLPQTKAYVMEQLKSLGYDPIEICESGIVATLTGSVGKTIMLRADMDALPVKETSACDFKSTNSCMHACGHDMHTAMLLGAAKLLNRIRINLREPLS